MTDQPRSLRPVAACAGLLALLAACASAREAQDLPAVIDAPTAASRVELGRTVAMLLGVKQVTLADHAFTRDSLLVVERVPARDAQDRRLNGRELGRPERFSLVSSDGRCVLVHERSKSRRVLTSAQCRPQQLNPQL